MRRSGDYIKSRGRSYLPLLLSSFLFLFIKKGITVGVFSPASYLEATTKKSIPE